MCEFLYETREAISKNTVKYFKNIILSEQNWKNLILDNQIALLCDRIVQYKENKLLNENMKVLEKMMRVYDIKHLKLFIDNEKKYVDYYGMVLFPLDISFCVFTSDYYLTSLNLLYKQYTCNSFYTSAHGKTSSDGKYELKYFSLKYNSHTSPAFFPLIHDIDNEKKDISINNGSYLLEIETTDSKKEIFIASMNIKRKPETIFFHQNRKSIQLSSFISSDKTSALKTIFKVRKIQQVSSLLKTKPLMELNNFFEDTVLKTTDGFSLNLKKIPMRKKLIHDLQTDLRSNIPKNNNFEAAVIVEIPNKNGNTDVIDLQISLKDLKTSKYFFVFIKTKYKDFNKNHPFQIKMKGQNIPTDGVIYLSEILKKIGIYFKNKYFIRHVKKYNKSVNNLQQKQKEKLQNTFKDFTKNKDIENIIVKAKILYGFEEKYIKKECDIKIHD